jgi:hypothetical protein
MALQHINALTKTDTQSCPMYPSSMYNTCYAMPKAINMMGTWHTHEQAIRDTHVYMLLLIIRNVKCLCMRTFFTLVSMWPCYAHGMYAPYPSKVLHLQEHHM